MYSSSSKNSALLESRTIFNTSLFLRRGFGRLVRFTSVDHVVNGVALRFENVESFFNNAGVQSISSAQNPSKLAARFSNHCPAVLGVDIKNPVRPTEVLGEVHLQFSVIFAEAPGGPFHVFHASHLGDTLIHDIDFLAVLVVGVDSLGLDAVLLAEHGLPANFVPSTHIRLEVDWLFCSLEV